MATHHKLQFCFPAQPPPIAEHVSAVGAQRCMLNKSTSTATCNELSDAHRYRARLESVSVIGVCLRGTARLDWSTAWR